MAPRVLSVQSSVVAGHVGNRSAVLPLQVCGFEVAELDTVQFATHTGYPATSGRRCTGDELRAVFDGLYAAGCQCGPTEEDADLTDDVRAQIDALEERGWAGFLTGYVPGAEGVEAVAYMALRVLDVDGDVLASTGERRNRKTVWVLDPVMGDEERGLYVAAEIPPLYQKLAPLADVVTPNMFELELLSGVACKDWASLDRAFDALHEKGCSRIVVTTFRTAQEPDRIHVVASDRPAGQRFRVDVPFYDRPYQGTGDLFAALLLANLLRFGQAHLRQAVCTALDAMKPVLDDTGRCFDAVVARHGGLDWKALRSKVKSGEDVTAKDRRMAALVCRACELRIVDNIGTLQNPRPFYTAADLR